MSRETLNFPSIVAPTRAAQAARISEIVERREFFSSELFARGALLLRGFGVENIEEFESFVRSFAEKELLDYAGGVSPRVSMSKNVYASTEYSPHLALSLHNELSYSANYPRQLYFFCVVAPEIGGATTVGDSRRILRNIDSEIVISASTPVSAKARRSTFRCSNTSAKFCARKPFRSNGNKTTS